MLLLLFFLLLLLVVGEVVGVQGYTPQYMSNLPAVFRFHSLFIQCTFSVQCSQIFKLYKMLLGWIEILINIGKNVMVTFFLCLF